MKMKHLALAVAAIGFTGQAFAAADEPKKVEKITITGSNIKRVSIETASPVQIITADEIKRGGATTLTEVLRNVASNVGGIDENRTGGFTAGASGLNLRGLGSQATLMLLNGRRLAAYAQPEFQTTFVDLNTLPIGAVERIEILKDGASAIYGSEAMAGVVNIILKESFVGAELGAAYGQSEVNDGELTRVTGSYGFGDLAQDHFNVYGTLDIRQQKPTFISKRDGYLSTQNLTAYGYQDQRSIYTDIGNIYWTDKTTGKFVIRPITGNCPADRLVSGDVIFGPGASVPGTQACVFDDLKDGTFNAGGKSDRISFTGKATWQPSESVTVFAEAMFNQNKARITGDLHWIAMQNGQPGGAFPITHPQYPKDLIDPVTGKTLAGGNGTVRLRAQLKTIPGQGQDNTVDFGRYLIGAKGDIGSWSWESAVMTNSSKVESRRTGGLLTDKFVNAVVTGQWLFGDAANNMALYPSLVTQSASNYESTLRMWDAKFSGDIMELPAGTMSAAVGVEARREGLITNPDPQAVAGNLWHSAKMPAGIDNSRNVRSVYTELSIPVLKNLEASLAGRFDHYSDYGNSKTPKLGLKWTALPELVVRSTYAEGFRAPTLVENSNQVADAFLNGFRDPARCTATFRAGCSSSSPYKSGANPDLKPETGKSYTLGLVWEPNKSFSASADFWNIKRTDEISTYDLTTVLNNEARYANNPATKIVRAPQTPAEIAAGVPGEITLVQLLLTNVAVTQVKGVDFDFRGRVNMGGFGKLEPRLVVQYTDSFKSAPTPTDEKIEYAGARGTPRVKGAAAMTWSKDPWTVNVEANYVGRMASVDDHNETCTFAVQGYDNLCNGISSYTTVNLSTTYKGFKNWSLNAAVRNAFDRNPPFHPYAVNTNYYRPLHNAMGRYFQVSAAYAFK
ncbi:TonB-dependent receptor [Chitinimonas sp. BJYL2]|uniref:TonB-dependent receptor n=1 Tax=Chitinimonas sp. BJYL2 TaxID=2976696 RepID=UPI0022B44D48|nr:TonB-dependent receptor [Chitinimonas sp. BJYL2]